LRVRKIFLRNFLGNISIQTTSYYSGDNDNNASRHPQLVITYRE